MTTYAKTDEFAPTYFMLKDGILNSAWVMGSGAGIATRQYESKLEEYQPSNEAEFKEAYNKAMEMILNINN